MPGVIVNVESSGEGVLYCCLWILHGILSCCPSLLFQSSCNFMLANKSFQAIMIAFKCDTGLEYLGLCCK